MAKDGRPILIVVLIIAALVFFNNPGFFGITLLSPQVQYHNEPIVAEFESELTNPLITAFFDDVKLCEETVTETVCGTIAGINCLGDLECILDDVNITDSPGVCIDTTCSEQTVDFSKETVNGTFVLTLRDVTQEGIFKFVAEEANLTEIQTVEVRRPFVKIQHDIPNVIDKGGTTKISIQTLTPQGDTLDADSVDIDVFSPDNKMTTIFLDKKASSFEVNFNYEDDGNYQFKIHGRKEGFDTVEKTVITSVVKSSGIHPIIWIWGGFIIVWLILFGIRRIRK